MTALHIPLVTSWGTQCGINEHSKYLKAAVEAADPEIELAPNAAWLDPEAFFADGAAEDIVHINHHDALHARWTTDHLVQLRDAGSKVVVTWHDTREGSAASPNSLKCRDWSRISDAFIVHEPVADICGPHVHAWRMGVPALTTSGFALHPHPFKAYADQPVVGSVGFAFPWKGFALLCDAAREAGWAVVLIAHNATDDQVADWHTRCPHLRVERTFLESTQVVQVLHACEATAFLYSCANTGQSGAILQGVAARRPVLASSVEHCRQFRSIDEAACGAPALDLVPAIAWAEVLTVERVAHDLAALPTAAHAVCRLAEQESWTRLGVKYAQLYRELAG
jgi:hypothetical protein